MKLVEVAGRVLTRRQFECWYMRRIENMEAEEVARRMSLSYATVYNYVWEATRTLADHAADIEDPDDYLCCMISILRGHRIENAVDSTPKAVFNREERENFANSVDFPGEKGLK